MSKLTPSRAQPSSAATPCRTRGRAGPTHAFLQILCLFALFVLFFSSQLHRIFKNRSQKPREKSPSRHFRTNSSISASSNACPCLIRTSRSPITLRILYWKSQQYFHNDYEIFIFLYKKVIINYRNPTFPKTASFLVARASSTILSSTMQRFSSWSPMIHTLFQLIHTLFQSIHTLFQVIHTLPRDLPSRASLCFVRCVQRCMSHARSR